MKRRLPPFPLRALFFASVVALSPGAFAQVVAVNCVNCLTWAGGQLIQSAVEDASNKVVEQTGQVTLLLKQAQDNALRIASGSAPKNSEAIASALSPIYAAYDKTQGVYHFNKTTAQTFLATNPQYGAELRKQLAVAKADPSAKDTATADFFSANADKNSQALYETTSRAMDIIGANHSPDVMRSEQTFIQSVLDASAAPTVSQTQLMQMTNQLIAALAASSQRARELSAQQASSQIAWIQYSVAKDEALRAQNGADIADALAKAKKNDSTVFKYLTGKKTQAQ